MLNRGLGSQLSSWQCPFGLRACNPCGVRSGSDDSWGKDGGGWEHIACRSYDLDGPSEFAGMWRSDMSVSRMGVVTNIHITDLKIPGTLESLGKGASAAVLRSRSRSPHARHFIAVLCPFRHLRELDLDGSALTGPIPRWIADCFPHLKELDLSFGRLSGPVPDWVPSMGNHLQQFKVQQNSLSGPLPPGLGSMPNLRVLWLHHNPGLSGPLPADLASSKSLISVDVRDNPKMCGELLAGLKVVDVPTDWKGFCAHAFTEDNSDCKLLLQPGTGIGKPCTSA